jgi:hypothetical protein
LRARLQLADFAIGEFLSHRRRVAK